MLRYGSYDRAERRLEGQRGKANAKTWVRWIREHQGAHSANSSHKEVNKVCQTRRVLGTLLGSAVLIFSVLPVIAAEVQKITVALTSPGGVQAIYWYTYKRGFFEKHGLDPTIVQVRGSSVGLNVLISGGAQFLADSLAGTVSADLSGADLVIVLAPISKFPAMFYVSPDIKDPNDLIGKKVAVSTFGGESHFSVLAALKVLGVPKEEVTILQIGTQPERLAALLSRQIAGATFTPPANLRAESEGLRKMVDLTESDKQYYSGPISVRKAFLNEHQDTVKAFIRAYVEAVRSYKTNSQTAKETLSAYTRIRDTKALNYAYEFYTRFYRENPKPECATVKDFLPDMKEATRRTAILSDPCSIVAESLY